MVVYEVGECIHRTLALPNPSSHLSGKFWCGKLICKMRGSPLLVYMKMNTIVIIEVRIANIFIAFRLIKSGERRIWTLFLFTHNSFGRTNSQRVKSCVALNSLLQVLISTYISSNFEFSFIFMSIQTVMYSFYELTICIMKVFSHFLEVPQIVIKNNMVKMRKELDWHELYLLSVINSIYYQLMWYLDIDKVTDTNYGEPQI